MQDVPRRSYLVPAFTFSFTEPLRFTERCTARRSNDEYWLFLTDAPPKFLHFICLVQIPWSGVIRVYDSEVYRTYFSPSPQLRPMVPLSVVSFPPSLFCCISVAHPASCLSLTLFFAVCRVRALSIRTHCVYLVSLDPSWRHPPSRCLDVSILRGAVHCRDVCRGGGGCRVCRWWSAVSSDVSAPRANTISSHGGMCCCNFPSIVFTLHVFCDGLHDSRCRLGGVGLRLLGQ